MPLPAGELHVWFVEPERVGDERLLEAYRTLLDSGERERQARLPSARRRHQHLVSHALLRTTLSRYAPLAPEAWRFVTHAHGRPEVAGLEGPRLCFNLSHTRGMALCAVALEAAVGVDVEDSERPELGWKHARHFLAPPELEALQALSPGRRHHRLLEWWTLKEAYLKARGTGLSLPMGQLAFHLEPGRAPRVWFDPRLADAPGDWHFVQLQPSARHHAALALRRDRGSPLRVRCQHVIPLEGEEPPWFIHSAPEAPGTEGGQARTWPR